MVFAVDDSDKLWVDASCISVCLGDEGDGGGGRRGRLQGPRGGGGGLHGNVLG